MQVEDILKIMKEFSNSNISEINLKDNSFELQLYKKENEASVIIKPQEEDNKDSIEKSKNIENIEVTDSIKSTNSKNDTNDVENKGENYVVSSPIVGTFYSAPAEGKDPFIKVGDTVKKGQVIGIIEAMKLMNEVESEYDGVVTDILVKNEQVVEYGQPLVVLR